MMVRRATSPQLRLHSFSAIERRGVLASKAAIFASDRRHEVALYPHQQIADGREAGDGEDPLQSRGAHVEHSAFEKTAEEPEKGDRRRRQQREAAPDEGEEAVDEEAALGEHE